MTHAPDKTNQDARTLNEIRDELAEAIRPWNGGKSETAFIEAWDACLEALAKRAEGRKYFIKGLTVYQSEPANIGKYETVITIDAHLKALARIQELESEHAGLKIKYNNCHKEIGDQDIKISNLQRENNSLKVKQLGTETPTQQLTLLEAQLKEAGEVIGFYGNEFNIDYKFGHGESLKIESSDKIPTYEWVKDDGKKARAYIAKWGNDGKE